MAYFKSSEELKNVLGGFFSEISEDPKIRKALLNSNLVIQFNYTEPDLSITINCYSDEVIITFDDQTTKPEVEMKMKADIAHRFWMGKLSLMIALARRQMIAKGPIPKILKLLPVIMPAYKRYPKYLKEHGFEHLNQLS